MRISSFTYRVRIAVELTFEEVVHIFTQACRMPDHSKHRNAARVDGFIRNWRNLFDDKEGQFATRTIETDYKELSMCCDILKTPASSGYLLNELQQALESIDNEITRVTTWGKTNEVNNPSVDHLSPEWDSGANAI